MLADLPAWSFAFMLVLARFGAAMALLPGLGEATVPAMVRVGLALGITDPAAAGHLPPGAADARRPAWPPPA